MEVNKVKDVNTDSNDTCGSLIFFVLECSRCNEQIEKNWAIIKQIVTKYDRYNAN